MCIKLKFKTYLLFVNKLFLMTCIMMTILVSVIYYMV